MSKYFKDIFFVLFFSFSVAFAQEELIGIWENDGRFVDFSLDNRENLKMRIILKPYYKFVYDKAREFDVNGVKLENSDSQFYLKIKYPLTKKIGNIDLCVENNCLFTSFYKKIDYFKNGQAPTSEYTHSPLRGFWIEQGHQNGILLYPNEAPNSVDAYFFNETTYIKFRYWLDDLAYNDKKAFFNGDDRNYYEFPKFLKRGVLVYSCITNNARVLLNFEKGSYSLKKDKSGERWLLSLNAEGAGPGEKAVADTYPHKKFIAMENLPLYVMDNNLIFAIGEPYLVRSDISDLDEAVKRHNKR